MRPTWAEVDLRAIRSNARRLAAFVAPSQVMAVVKADAYGHGATRIAHAALDGGASSLGVALLEEAIELRNAGVRAPILVFGEVGADVIEIALRAQIELSVTSARIVDALSTLPRELVAGAELHVKIDTGMHRSGCSTETAILLIRKLSELGVTPQLWTHLACADDPSHPATELQIAHFDAATAALRAAGLAWNREHIANSAGALEFRAARRDMVRCGIALYGVAPYEGRTPPIELTPALSLHSRVASIRTIEGGESVSYGWRWTASQPTTIATIPIGYADGVPRRLGLTGGEVLVRGRYRPIRGVVTMDQLMIEVDDEVEIGDEVVLLGSQGSLRVNASDWARRLDTIPYEILTNIGPRVPRRTT